MHLMWAMICEESLIYEGVDTLIMWSRNAETHLVGATAAANNRSNTMGGGCVAF